MVVESVVATVFIFHFFLLFFFRFFSFLVAGGTKEQRLHIHKRCVTYSFTKAPSLQLLLLLFKIVYSLTQLIF